MRFLLLSILALVSGALLTSPALGQVTIPGTANDMGLFGHTLAYGDFDGDGDDDLAIGTPQDGGTTPDLGVEGGSVTVLYLAADGRTATGAASFVQGRDGVPNLDEAGDFFGGVLAVGDFNGDGRDDLAIGAPFEAVGTTSGAGAVVVLYGSDAGLTSEGAAAFDQSSAGVPGAAEANDSFARALAAGDFDGDGADDLAIGVPGEAIGTIERAGYVTVLMGGASGLSTAEVYDFTRASTGGTAAVAEGDQFGRSLATGDLDGDGRDELAIGMPFADQGAIDQAGGVVVLEGTDDGPSAVSADVLFEDDLSVSTMTEDRDQFGLALAFGDFNGDGLDDLAIGAPGETVSTTDNVGAVFVLTSSTDGLSLAAQFFAQAVNVTAGAAEEGDAFAFTLAASDFDGDGRDDLAIGTPGEDIGTTQFVGAAFILYGTENGLNALGAQDVNPGQDAFPGAADAGEAFSWGLAASAPRPDGRASLAIGAPWRTVDAVAESGIVYVLTGTEMGLTTDAPIPAVPGGTFPEAAMTAAEDDAHGTFVLGAPAPNPTRGSATLTLELATSASGHVALYDALGRELAVLHDGPLAAGRHSLTVATARLVPGTYLVRAQSEQGVAVRQLVVVR